VDIIFDVMSVAREWRRKKESIPVGYANFCMVHHLYPSSGYSYFDGRVDGNTHSYHDASAACGQESLSLEVFTYQKMIPGESFFQTMEIDRRSIPELFNFDMRCL
jgi:hypothetical protein